MEQRASRTDTWWVYIIRCKDGSLYTGIAKDVDRRFSEHASQGPKCAKYLRGKGPFKLVHIESACNRSEASQREYAIKQLKKSEKLKLCKSSCKLTLKKATTAATISA